MVKRKYTGFDSNAPGPRAGLEKFVELTVKHFDGGVWNNGTWGPRMMRNPGVSKPSVHGTGRAADMSWRRGAGAARGGYGDYAKSLWVAEFWIANAELFMIEAIHDYFPEPWGRGWQCDRSAWLVYKSQKIGSAPGGDWFHVEVAPVHADDPAFYEHAFASIDGAPAVALVPGPPPSVVAPAGVVVPPGNPELSVVFRNTIRDDVKALQGILITHGWADFTKADGRYGDHTTDAVRKMQTVFGFSGTQLDGKYGPHTANKLAEWLAAGN